MVLHFFAFLSVFVCAGNHVFGAKEDTDVQSKILSLLLHKSLVPVPEKNDPLGEGLRNNVGLNYRYSFLPGC